MARSKFAQGMAQAMGSASLGEDFPPLRRDSPVGSSSTAAAEAGGPSDEGKGHWSSLFGSSSEATLSFHPPVISNGKKVVSIPKSVHEQGLIIWEDCLLGQFYGPAPKLSFIKLLQTISGGEKD